MSRETEVTLEYEVNGEVEVHVVKYVEEVE